jgi:glycine dehydrogenase
MNLFEQQQNEFLHRHIGPNETEAAAMLKTIGANSLEDLIQQTVPDAIRLQAPLQTGGPMSEFEYLSDLVSGNLKQLRLAITGRG